ncbi:hypothetical protein BGW39_007061 [Mortierella sp. 14UC]|nr:hypothetical protein BGW39_007061 [Mortierella sp. 14UC]
MVPYKSLDVEDFAGLEELERLELAVWNGEEGRLTQVVSTAAETLKTLHLFRVRNDDHEHYADLSLPNSRHLHFSQSTTTLYSSVVAPIFILEGSPGLERISIRKGGMEQALVSNVLLHSMTLRDLTLDSLGRGTFGRATLLPEVAQILANCHQFCRFQFMVANVKGSSCGTGRLGSSGGGSDDDGDDSDVETDDEEDVYPYMGWHCHPRLATFIHRPHINLGIKAD